MDFACSFLPIWSSNNCKRREVSGSRSWSRVDWWLPWPLHDNMHPPKCSGSQTTCWGESWTLHNSWVHHYKISKLRVFCFVFMRKLHLMYLFLCIQPATKSHCFVSSPNLQKQLGQDWQKLPSTVPSLSSFPHMYKAPLHGPNYNNFSLSGAFLKMTSISHLNLTFFMPSQLPCSLS